MNTYLTKDGAVLNSDSFTLEEFLADIDPRLLDNKIARKTMTKYNPLLFLLLYTPHLLKSEATNDKLSVNDLNIALSHYAMEFAAPKSVPKRKGLRKAFICPRSVGKTTTIQALLIWALCHGHLKYVYVLAGSADKAEEHLSAIKHELITNKLIMNDYKEVIQPPTNPAIRKEVISNRSLFVSASGIILEARSIWSTVLGALREGRRPDCVILDDICRGEGVGSVHQSEKQLDVLVGTVLPMNDAAPVWAIGTVHYSGSVEDELLRSTLGEYFRWVEEENFEVHWVKPLRSAEDGSLRSVWKERWSVDFLLSESHKHSYSKDFMNRPINKYSGSGFTSDLFIVEQPPSLSFIVISIDPQITDKGDATGISVIGFSNATMKSYILESLAVHMRSTDLKMKIIELIDIHGAEEIVWEATQGGTQLYYSTMGNDFPLHAEFIYPKADKIIRSEILLGHFKKDHIRITKPLPGLVAEALQFPRFIQSPNQLDSVSQAVDYVTKVSTPKQPRVRQSTYSRR